MSRRSFSLFFSCVFSELQLWFLVFLLILNILLSTSYVAGLMPHTWYHFHSTLLKGSSYHPDSQMQKLSLAKVTGLGRVTWMCSTGAYIRAKLFTGLPRDCWGHPLRTKLFIGPIVVLAATYMEWKPNGSILRIMSNSHWPGESRQWPITKWVAKHNGWAIATYNFQT